MPNDDDTRPNLRLMPSKSGGDERKSGVSDEDRCGFCGKRRSQVESLVAGPAVFICNECVAACNKILKDDA